MSTWKNYGGLHNAEKTGRISAEYIYTKEFTLEQPYNGLFNIFGELRVSGNTNLDVLNVNNNTFINRDAVIGRNGGDKLTINSDTTFSGDAIFIGGTASTGNVISLDSLIAYKNVFIGNTIAFGNRYFPPVQAIYSGINGLGINQIEPEAALDISSNQPYSISVVSSNPVNKSVLVQNVSGQSIMIAVDPSNANIQFYHDNKLVSEKADAYINYSPGGFLNIDVSNNLNVSSQMTIADNNKTITHVNNETLAVYDISSGYYYPNIYNKNLLTGSAATFVSSDLYSNTFIHINTPAKKGVSIGGGAYPVDNLYRNSGIISLSNNTNPTQMIVSGNSTVKYFSTTGINTFQPRIDKYVLDVNGPVHIDNGDSVSAVQTPFQIYDLSVAKNYRNIAIAVGSSIDISRNVATYFREQIIKTTDYGASWKTIDLSYSFLNNCDFFTNIYLVDTSYCFITGNTTLIFSKDCGATWRNIFGIPVTANNIYNNVYINSNLTSTGNLEGYCSLLDTSTLVSFEYNPIVNSGILSSAKLFDTSSHISSIKYIRGNDNILYLVGNAIVKYNVNIDASLNKTLQLNSYHSYSPYTYNAVNILNDFVICVGNNIISSSTDNGISWVDVSFNNFNVNFRNVHIIDSYNAIACGWYGNIWITKNSGVSWNHMPQNLINASGKGTNLTSTSNMFENITMTDNNTILVVNTIQPYSVKNSVNGISNIYNIFTPNYINRENNSVLDISGVVNISGDLKIIDNGSVISTNSSMNLFSTTVKTIQFGNDANDIVIGDFIGNTTIRTNLISKNNITMDSYDSTFYTAGRMYVQRDVIIGEDTTIFGSSILNGTVTVNNSSNFMQDVYINDSDVVLDKGNVVVGNVIPVGAKGLTIGGANNDIYIGGLYNDIKQQKIYIGQSELVNRGNVLSKSIIYIGGTNDEVVIRGNTNILNMQEMVVKGPTAFVNVPSEGFGANVTCAGAGLDIFDNSYSSFAPSNVYSYMHVGKDMQSFVFKAPSYGAYTDPITKTQPLFDTNKNIQLISPENRVRLGINQLTLSGTNVNGTTIKNGLIILKSDADFKTYQAQLGQGYDDFSSSDADYAISILPDFDISNILLKDFDISNQTIRSNLIVGSETNRVSVFTYGNTITYGNTRLYRDLYTSGNIFIANTTDSAASTGTGVGALVVSGGVGIGGNVVMNGAITSYSNKSTTFSGTNTANSSGNGALILNAGGLYVQDNIYVAGSNNSTTISCSKTANSSGDGALILNNGGLFVNQNIVAVGNIIASATDTINGIVINNRAVSNITTLNASDFITFSKNSNPTAIGVNAAVNISQGGLSVNNDTYIGGRIIVTGTITANNTSTINGVTINNRAVSNITTLNVSDVATFTSNVNSANNATGALIVSNGGLYVKQSIFVAGTTNSSSISTGALIVSGGVGINNNTYIGGLLNVTSTITANTTSTINGVSIDNRAVSNITTLNTSGVASLTNTTESSTTGTGALVVSGGVGVAKNVRIGGLLSVAGETSSLSFNATSDYRMKKNVQPLLSSRTIDLLKPVEYSITDGIYQMGFLAHEVQEIFPFLVNGEKDGEKIQTLNYNGFIPLLVKEIQDLKSENQLLKSRLDAIEKILGDGNEKSRLERFREAFHHAR